MPASSAVDICRSASFTTSTRSTGEGRCDFRTRDVSPGAPLVSRAASLCWRAGLFVNIRAGQGGGRVVRRVVHRPATQARVDAVEFLPIRILHYTNPAVWGRKVVLPNGVLM